MLGLRRNRAEFFNRAACLGIGRPNEKKKVQEFFMPRKISRKRVELETPMFHTSGNPRSEVSLDRLWKGRDWISGDLLGLPRRKTVNRRSQRRADSHVVGLPLGALVGELRRLQPPYRSKGFIQPSNCAGRARLGGVGASSGTVAGGKPDSCTVSKSPSLHRPKVVGEVIDSDSANLRPASGIDGAEPVRSPIGVSTRRKPPAARITRSE